MKIASLTLLIAALLIVPPTAVAHHCREGSAPREETLALDVPETPAGPARALYVLISPTSVGIWEESGQEDGLQSKGGSCGTGHDERHYGTDDKVLVVDIPALA